MEEMNKLGDINSVNDLFDFKISIKTILFLAVAWGAVCLVVLVFMFGGVNNTVKYVLTLLETLKSTVLKSRNKVVVADKPSNDKVTNDKPLIDKPSNDKVNND
jgi:hypothetical protein